MAEDFAETLLNDFVFADSRLGSHPVLRSSAFWLDGRSLTSGESAPPTSLRRGLRLERGQGLVDSAFRHRKAITVAETGGSSSISERFDLRETMRSALSIPLFDANQPVGVLSFDSRVSSFFSERHLQPATLLGILLVHAHWHAGDRHSSPSSRAVGQAMRQARESLGVTQTALASRIGINRITLSRQESGAQPPTTAALYRWAQALDLIATTTAARVEIIEITPRIKRLLEEDPRLLSQLTPEQFERFVAERIDRMGYDVTLAGAATLRDGGIDLIAVPKVRTVGAFLLAGQVKHHSSRRRTGREAVDRLLAWKDSDFRLGLLVTNTDFTRDARWVAELEQHRKFVRLRNFDDLKRWIRNDFTSDRDWREVPEQIDVAPGITIRVPSATLTRPELVWPQADKLERK